MTNHPKKVIIIPSWYPTPSNPIAGSFFREQALLMSNDFDIKILIGKEIDSNKLFFIKYIIPRLIKGNISFSKNENYISPPQVLSFNCFISSRIFPYSTNHNLIFNQYKKVLESLIKDMNWKPDLIHGHCTYKGGIVAVDLGKEFSIPTIITEHFGPFLLHRYPRFYIEKILISLQNTDKLISISTDKMRIINMHGIQREQIVFGNFVDERIFTLPNKKKKSNVFRILIVAYLDFIKDLPTFFAAIYEMIRHGHDSIRATIIVGGLGGNLSKNAYENFAKEHGVYKYCSFVYKVPREQMSLYYENNDVLVSTSIAEGCQVSVLEALACGLPVVSTANGSFEDIVTPYNGIMIKIKDFKAIAQALIKIKNGEIKFDRNKIRENVVEKHGSTAFRNRMKNIYENTMREFKG